MKTVVESIEAVCRRYKSLADAAMAQLDETELSTPGPSSGNSVAVIGWHIAGNLTSRFTDFLTMDGYKPWRDREDEFAARTPTRQELTNRWERGWDTLFDSLSHLTDDHLQQTVLLRGKELQVNEALHRTLGHMSYHVGQIVYLAKALKGEKWRYLSIPPGESESYDRKPTSERAESRSSRLKDSVDKESI